MSYPNLKNEDPTLLKLATRDDEIKEFKYKTGIHDYENFLKSLEIHEDYCKKNFSKINKKIFIRTSEFLTSVSGLDVGSSLSITGVRASTAFL